MVSSRHRARAFAFLATLLATLFVGAVSHAQGGTFGRTTLSVRTGAGITAEADYLSGRNLEVECSTTAGGWAQALAAAGLPSAEADEYYGFSLIPEGELHLSPYVCEGLRLGSAPATRRTHELQVAWSVDVLVHESVHMGRFTYDEALAEACARVGLPAELHRLFGVAYHSAELSRLTLAASSFRSTQAPAYQGGTCPPAS